MQVYLCGGRLVAAPTDAWMATQYSDVTDFRGCPHKGVFMDTVDQCRRLVADANEGRHIEPAWQVTDIWTGTCIFQPAFPTTIRLDGAMQRRD